MAPLLHETLLDVGVIPALDVLKVGETEPIPHKIIGPLAWDGKSFRNEAEYVYKLSEGEVREISQALKNFQDLGLDGDEINRGTFLLPDLGPRLEMLARELHHGKGFVVISGLDPHQHSAEDNALIFLGVGSYLGEVRGMQTDDGKLFGHLRNAPNMKAGQMDRPIKDSNRFAAFHNDLCTDIIAMQARSSAQSGGDHLIASVAQIHNELLRRRPHLLNLLLRPNWPLDIRRRFCTTDTRPLLWHCGSHIISSIIPDALFGFENMERTAGLPAMTAEQMEAINEVQALAQRFSLSLPTRAGDLTFINNLAVLHAREAFEDSEENRRYLVRMWLKNETLAWKLPPQLELGNQAIFYDEKLERDWNLMPVDRTMFQVYERSAP